MQGGVEPRARAPRPIDPGVTIGHVHLRTAGIDRVRDFYVGVLGFDVVAEERGVPGWGTTGDVLFLSAGGYHHHLAFNTWKSKDGDRQPDGVAGLHRGHPLPHARRAWPTRCMLQEAQWPIRQASDHGTHEAIYLSDPDGNDLELCWDRPAAEWARDEHGHLRAVFDTLDLDELAAHDVPAS